MAKLVQEQRDNRRFKALPSVNRPDVTRDKSQHSRDENDLLDAMIKLQNGSGQKV